MNSDEEGKFHVFNEMNFTKICIGMRDPGSSFSTVKFKEIEIQSSHTLLDIFKTSKYINTNIGLSAWLDLIANSALQPHCNREGFNVYGTHDFYSARARLGIMGNNENDCDTPDSVLGFGIAGNGCELNPPASGVESRCGPIIRKSVIGYIFLR